MTDCAQGRFGAVAGARIGDFPVNVISAGPFVPFLKAGELQARGGAPGKVPVLTPDHVLYVMTKMCLSGPSLRAG
ncbi:MAG: hypothetical protein ACYTFQ_27205, partial [Planctomycetota bacterium]